jgi:SP family arabinose:H+ symporter-like MFS transporter
VQEHFNKSYLWRICLVSTLGGLLFGYDWVVIAGAKPFYELYFNLSDELTKGWAMSSALVGCMLGAITSGVLSDRFGRKKLLILAALLFTLSAVGTGLVHDFTAFIVFRLVGGIGIGLASNLSPMYIAEVSPAKTRGKMVSLNQLAIVIGIVAAQVVNWLIARDLTADLEGTALLNSWYGQTAWRWMFAAETLPAALFFILMFTVPESPRWLIQNGQEDLAAVTLTTIGGDRYAQGEITNVQALIARESHQAGITELFQPKVMRIILIGVILAAYQQLCGINVILLYAEEVFKAAGYQLSGIMINIVTTGIVLLLFTFVAIFSVDRLGRRALMLAGSAGLVVLHAAIALCYMNHSEGIHVLLLILAAIACYASTLAPITWVLLAELFPNRVRGAAMSIAVLALWVTCAGVAQGFPILHTAVGASGSFWTFSGICLFGLLFCWKALPETRGKSLEEVEAEILGIEFQE